MNLSGVQTDEKTKNILMEWKAEMKEKTKPSRADDSYFFPKIAEGFSYIPYQRVGVKWLIDKQKEYGCSLLADEMGLGKTLQSIGYCNEMKPNKVLVTCLASLKKNWHNEFLKFGTNDYSYQIIQGRREKILSDSNVIIINYDVIDAYIDQLKEIDFDCIIADEVHTVKNPKAKRSKAFYSLDAKMKIASTGTPISNRPIELFHILKWLNKSIFPNWYEYARRFCEGHKNDFGFFEAKGSSNLEELQDALRSTIMIRRLKKNVLKDLPEKTVQIVMLDGLSKKEQLEQQKIIQEIETIGFENLLKSSLLDDSENKLISRIAKMRKEMADKKASFAKEFISNLLETEKKLVVFGHHKSLVRGLKSQKEYDPISVLIDGETSSNERQGIIDQFQNDASKNLFFGSMRACNAGITLTAAKVGVLLECDFNPAIMQQVMDRIHRIGQKSNVHFYIFVFANSIDSWIAKIVKNKIDNNSKALD
jgi:SWI/SNF-related matrix-associated actin-dependent regulator 1 of chromatin subfamily A